MSYQLTAGAIAGALSDAAPEKPILQILDIKEIPTTAGTKRYRAVMSDGVHHSTTMFAQPLNARIETGEISALSVCQLSVYTVNVVSQRKLMIILDLEILGNAGMRLGAPVSYSAEAAAAATGAAPAHAAAPAAAAPAPPTAAFAAQYQQQQQQYQPQPQPVPSFATRPQPSGASSFGGSRASAGPTVSSSSSSASSVATIPINSLTPFTQRWTIKARVTAKQDIKNWNNARGSGQLFGATLVDEHHGEIRATFFQEAVPRFFPLLEVGKVYMFSNGKVKIANKAFTSVRNDNELSFDEKAVISEAPDDARIARAVYSFVKIGNLSSVEPNKMIDVIGVIASLGEAATINSKAGKELQKRDLVLADDSGAQITCTLWAEKTALPLNAGEVVALKGVKLSDYGGRSLSTMGSSSLEVGPDVPDAHRLLGWWADSGASSSLRNLTERGGGGGGGGGAGGEGPLTVVELRKTVDRIKDDAPVGVDGGIFVSKVTITNLPSDPSKLWYAACTAQRDGRTCNKKLNEENGSFNCPMGCFTTAPAYRYIVSAGIADSSGFEYATLFDETASAILGHSATELHAMVAAGGGEAGGLPPDVEAVMKAVLWREYLLTTKAKMDDRNGTAEQRLKVTVVKARDVEYARESKALAAAISRYMQ